MLEGCAFAKDLLKAFIGPLKRECPGGRPWDYADDITRSRCKGKRHKTALRRCMSLPVDMEKYGHATGSIGLQYLIFLDRS